MVIFANPATAFVRVAVEVFSAVTSVVFSLIENVIIAPVKLITVPFLSLKTIFLMKVSHRVCVRGTTAVIFSCIMK